MPALVRQILGLVGDLEDLCPGRKFTLDGHIVGSIGEVLAAERYGLTLLPMSATTHDAETGDGRLVQIKTTQGKAIAITSSPDHLLVLRLDGTGSIEEVFNGPGSLAWAQRGTRQKNGQHRISTAKLRQLMATAVQPTDRIPTS